VSDFPYERDVDELSETWLREQRSGVRVGEPRRYPLDRARALAVQVRDELAPFCDRIEIAGSVRRRVSSVKDVELVAVPKLFRNLFGEPNLDAANELDVHVQQLILAGRLEPRLNSAGVQCMGPRHKRLVAVRSGIPIDLFCVLPPASWGALLAIRTGPAEYSERLVTVCQRRGLRCEQGRLVDAQGRELATPEEADFIKACGEPYAEPWMRR
jgi:DNA polymerase/3'-5' exonuclease PolX